MDNNGGEEKNDDDDDDGCDKKKSSSLGGILIWLMKMRPILSGCCGSLRFLKKI